MALASRHGVHALHALGGAPAPFLRRSAPFILVPGSGSSRSSSQKIDRSLRIQAKKLESSSSSGKNSKAPDSSSKIAVSDEQQKSKAPDPATSSTTPGVYPNDDYFDPGMVPDFWEGPQWNWLGFVLQYLWAIGIVVAIIVCAILFVTYKPRPIDYKLREGPTLEEATKILNERRNPGAADEQEAPAPQIEEQAFEAEEKKPEIKAEAEEEANVVQAEVTS